MVPTTMPTADRITIWPSDWPRDLRQLSDHCKREVAHIIAEKLRHDADGGVLTDPDTWEALALNRGIGLDLYADIMAGPGEYMPPNEPDGPAMIAINHAFSREVQGRAWVHEFAHDELHRWIPPQLDDAADLYCYSGDLDEERHDIARRVELILLGEE